MVLLPVTAGDLGVNGFSGIEDGALEVVSSVLEGIMRWTMKEKRNREQNG